MLESLTAIQLQGKERQVGEMLIYEEFLLLAVPPLLVILLAASAEIGARLLVGRSSVLDAAIEIVLPAIPVVLFLLSRIVLVGFRFSYFNAADLPLTVELVVFSLCAHGLAFLFLNDLLESHRGYLRAVGRLYVVLVSISLAWTILLPMLRMNFSG